MKKSTSLDVAKRAGVSQAAVSLILNGNDKINFSSATRERVLLAARELGYQLPQRRKKRSAAAKKHNRLLLVLTPTLTNHYYAELLQAIEAYADTLNYRVMICNTFRKPELEKFYLDALDKTQIDGIIYTFLPTYPHLIEQIALHTPTVIIGEKRSALSICSIELSNISAGILLGEHLYQLGHRRLAFISTPFNQLSLAREQRLEGIRKQFASHGLSDVLELHTPEKRSETELQGSNLPYEYVVGRQLCAELIRKGCRASALIGVNDMTALGILNELADQGLRVPEDYSVCGFDNIFMAGIVKPGLTTIDHHLHTRSQAAVDMIIAQSRHGSAQEAPMVNKIEYAPQLIVRGSTGPRSATFDTV